MEPMLYRRPTSLEEQIKAERDNMMQAIFPSERMRHASKIAKLENQLEDRKEYAKRLADCEEREEGI